MAGSGAGRRNFDDWKQLAMKKIFLVALLFTAVSAAEIVTEIVTDATEVAAGVVAPGNPTHPLSSDRSLLISHPYSGGNFLGFQYFGGHSA